MNTEAQALAAEIRRLAAEMSSQDVSAAMSEKRPTRYALDVARTTASAFDATIDRLAAMAQPKPPEGHSASASNGSPGGAWQWVPVEPTEAMIDATHHGQPVCDIYRDMLAAAPTPGNGDHG